MIHAAMQDEGRRTAGGAPRAAMAVMAAALALMGLVVPLVGMAAAPEPQGRVAIIYPPWTSAGQALGRTALAGGRLVRFGGAPWIVVAAPAETASAAAGQRLAARARERGALAVVNPQVVGGCGDLAVPAAAPRQE